LFVLHGFVPPFFIVTKVYHTIGKKSSRQNAQNSPKKFGSIAQKAKCGACTPKAAEQAPPSRARI